MISFFKRVGIGLSGLLLLCSIFFANTNHAFAAVINPTPKAQISFTFDDGFSGAISKAAPTLANYGYSGTEYIITSKVGTSGYMSWNQIQSLQNNYGWEIGSHSVTHPLLTKLNASKLENEVSASKQALVSRGINATSFATPYGDYNSDVEAAIARHYTNHRPFHDAGYNTWPYNNYLLRVQQVQFGVSVDTVKSYIDQAVANQTWLILVFHNIADNPSTSPSNYEYSTSDLASIASYAKAKAIKNTNVSKGLVSPGANDNLLPNPVSGSALGNGWSTDTASNVSINNGTNGSMPEPRISVKVLGSGTKDVHIFTPKIAVNTNSVYGLKGYINASSLQGEIGFYIDEYDSNGNWVSGQYKKTISNNQTKDLAVSYQPSSGNVTQARLQIITSQNANISFYFDNMTWFLSSGTTTPTPQPTNMLVNGTFEAGLTGWRTDNSAAISLDTSGNGSSANPQNSVKMIANNIEGHLFSENVAVDSSKTYSISGYVNVVTLSSGEIGFYIDEYDTNGNWVSGQYITGVRSVGARTASFSYKPSSVNVRSSSLQFILNQNSGISGYIDNFIWTTQ